MEKIIIIIVISILIVIVMRKMTKSIIGSYSKSESQITNTKDEYYFDDKTENEYQSEFYSNYHLKTIPTYLLNPKESIKNVHNYFARKKIVLTGDLDNFPERKDIAELLWNLGADIDTKVSERINIVITGNEPGWDKMSSIENLQSIGHQIEVMNEEQLMEILPAQIDIDDEDVSLMELANTKFCITGTFDYFNGQNIKLLINDRGGSIGALSTSTTVLLVGANPNHEIIEKVISWNKKNKAQIAITDENEFLRIAFPNQKFYFEEPLPQKPFEGQNVLISGDFTTLSREDLRKYIVLLGGNNVTSISKKLNCFIKGDKVGPAKDVKIELLISQGVDINVINENDFVRILNNVTKNYSISY